MRGSLPDRLPPYAPVTTVFENLSQTISRDSDDRGRTIGDFQVTGQELVLRWCTFTISVGSRTGPESDTLVKGAGIYASVDPFGAVDEETQECKDGEYGEDLYAGGRGMVGRQSEW
jgi:hypothetical protein